MKPRLDRKANFLDFVPVPQVSTETDEDGMTVLLVPKFRRWPFRTLIPRMKYPNFKIRLDEVGTFIWSRCDGSASVGAIAADARERFAEKVEPAEERTAVFVRRLLDARAIRLDPGRAGEEPRMSTENPVQDHEIHEKEPRMDTESHG